MTPDAATAPSPGEILLPAREIDILPGTLCSIEGSCHCDHGSIARAALLVAEFLDDQGTKLDGPLSGLAYSPSIGHFAYLRANDSKLGKAFRVALEAPEEAARLRFDIRSWASNQPIRIPQAPRLRLQGLTVHYQTVQAAHLIERLFGPTSAATDSPRVILSATTKRIGEPHRANRPMLLASELAAQGVPTLYVYYRFDPQDGKPEALNDHLVQLPNDIFHRLAPWIAEQKTSAPKLFVISIPDAPSVLEVDLFSGSGWNTLYEARDDWEAFYEAGVGRWYHPLYERYLCARADAVSTVSPALAGRMIVLGASPSRTTVIPNGTTQAFVDQARPAFNKRRAGSRHATPVIGYFGHLTEAWFDWPLVLSAARQHPEWRFEIIGFGEPKKLALTDNVELLGPCPHDQIVEHTEHWSVGLVPFTLGRLARGVDPIKYYEYVALGLPCVACSIPQLDDAPLAFLYECDQDFTTCLDRALGHRPTEAEWDAALELLSRSTWRHRASETLRFAGIDGLPRTSSAKL